MASTVALTCLGNAKPADRPAQPRITCDIKAQTLRVFEGEKLVKQYTVAIGKQALRRPGTYRISEKMPKPTWWSPMGQEIPYGDKDNPLGSRWLSLKATGNTAEVNGLGIHGGWDGKKNSAMCIGMRNADVKALSDLIPKGTPVILTAK